MILHSHKRLKMQCCQSFFGECASSEAVTYSIRQILKHVKLPVVEILQGAGIVSRDLEEDTFFGRVGLFRNQPGDMLLKKSDLIIAIGYDPSV
ncbi:MAG: hypothetical protein ACLUOJ_04730 [Streptococcus salivarius]